MRLRTITTGAPLVLAVLAVLAAAACDKEVPAAVGAPAASSAAPAAAPAPVDAAPSRPTGKAVETPAGLASEVGDEILLAGKPLFPPADCAGRTDGCAKVKVLREGSTGVHLLRHFDGPGGARSILLLQVDLGGNACTGGPLFFVRVAKDRPAEYSEVFDHCGPAPAVQAMAEKITLVVPAHAPNRGTGTVPATSIDYDIATGKMSKPKKKG